MTGKLEKKVLSYLKENVADNNMALNFLIFSKTPEGKKATVLKHKRKRAGENSKIKTEQ